jgi:hypothetical protein
MNRVGYLWRRTRQLKRHLSVLQAIHVARTELGEAVYALKTVPVRTVGAIVRLVKGEMR